MLRIVEGSRLAEITIDLLAYASQQARSLETKKKEGNDAFTAGKAQEAYDFYTEALAIDPLHDAFNAQLYCNRAAAAMKVPSLSR